MKLIAIGYWYSDSEPEMPNPLNFVDATIAQQDRQLLINYLNSGKRLHEWMGFSACRFKCGRESHKMGNACLTDGKFIWPEGLSHYISEHQVWLPTPFINHAKENQNFIDQNIEINESAPSDYNWWKTFKI